ncbi:alpha tubulin suppressor [Coniothyrium glycines]
MTHHLFAFGSNGEGQLGIPAAEIVDTPVRVPVSIKLESLKSIRAGDNHSLLHLRNRSVHGAGDNRKGQLGYWIDNKTHLRGFELLLIAADFIAATCETSAYVHIDSTTGLSWITTEGTAHWGELGCGDSVTSTALDGPDETHTLPEPLPGAVIDFAAGVWHYVAILADGSVFGWGKARLGQLGSTLTEKTTVPTKVEGIPFKPKKVVCGKDFSYFAGNPISGEHIVLGKDKFGITSNKPEHIRGWKDIGATWHAIFVLFANGTLTAWGKDNMWQLLPPNLPPIDKIAIGSDHVLAVTRDNRLLSWGWGKHGNCGSLHNTMRDTHNDMLSGFWNEIDVPGRVDAVAAGYCTSFVLTRSPDAHA